MAQLLLCSGRLLAFLNSPWHKAMAVTVNIYQQSAIRYLATYGMDQQDAKTFWFKKLGTVFALLCSTDVAQFDSSYTGRVDQLLGSGVTELPTANGYTKGGQYVQNLYTYYNGPGPFDFSQESSLIRGSKLLELRPASQRFPGSGDTINCFRWVPSGTLSAKSLLLCLQTPLNAANSSEPIYSASYPLAMVDFGGTVTGTPGSVLAVPYPIVATAIRWTID
jgi:hypothetical protein